MAADSDHRETLMEVYRAFNARNIDAVLAHFAPGVDWPNGMTGGREVGRDAVRAYWTRQWREIDPRVEPLRIEADDAGRMHVRVQQLIRSMDGKIIENREIEHVYEFEGPFVRRMTIVPVAPEPDEDE